MFNSVVMKKKRYNFTIDENVHDTMVAYLKPKGITLSAYVNSMLIENLTAINQLKGVKNVGDISLKTIINLFSGIQDEFKKNVRKGKK
jgi:hypothetical protein